MMTVLFYLYITRLVSSICFSPHFHTSSRCSLYKCYIFHFHVWQQFILTGRIAVWQTKKNELNHSNKYSLFFCCFLPAFDALYPENDDHANDQRLVNFSSFHLHPTTKHHYLASTIALCSPFSTLYGCYCCCWYRLFFLLLLSSCRSRSSTHSQSIIHKKMF